MTMTTTQVLLATAEELETTGWTTEQYESAIGCHCAVGGMVAVLSRDDTLLRSVDRGTSRTSSPLGLNDRGRALVNYTCEVLARHLDLDAHDPRIALASILSWNDRQHEVTVVTSAMRAAAA